MTPIDPESLVLVGRLIKTHGVRGEMKMIPESDEPAHLAALSGVYVGDSAQDARHIRVSGLRLQPKKGGALVLLSLQDVDDIDAAERLVGKNVYAAEADLPLADDEHFIHDLIGLTVETVAGESVGVVRDVMALPAHAVLVVSLASGHEALIPLVEALVPEIDVEAGRIVVDPVEGLLA